MVQAHKLKRPRITEQQASVLYTLQANPGTHIQLTGAEGVYGNGVVDTARRVYMPSVRRLIALHYLVREGTIVTLTEQGKSYGNQKAV